MKRVCSLLVLAVLQNGCDSKTASEAASAPQAAPSAPAPVHEPAAPTPVAPAEDDVAPAPSAAEELPTTDARVLAIRERYAEIEADPGLAPRSFDHACPGGEGGAKVRVFERNGVAHKAEVELSMPGHSADGYSLYYDKGKVMFALYTMSGWSFAEGGTPEKPATRDTVTEYRYYFDGGKAFSCLKKHAEGPSGQIATLLRTAQNQPDDCSRAGRVQKLAAAVTQGEKGSGELAKLVCP